MPNPFIDNDNVGDSDVLLQALRFKMKIWDLKSESTHELILPLGGVVPG